MNKYNIIFETPELELHGILTKEIFELKKIFPEVFNENINLINIKHSYQYCIWSYNHSRFDYCPYEFIENNINLLKDLNMGLYFEFENTKLEQTHFYDRFSNMLLEIAQDITELKAFVHNNNLALYLKNKYPNIEIIKSSMKKNIKIEYPYNKCAIDYKTYIENREEICSNADKYILYLNSFCLNNYNCVDFYSECKVNFNEKTPFPCNNIFESFKESQQSNLFIDNEKIININKDGINNFIIKANADNKYEILECYLYYLIKPQHRDYVRLKILKNSFMQV